MTVLTSENTLLGSATGRLPRVNLMPPEVAAARQARRLQLALGAVGVGAVAIVGVLYVSAGHSLSSAKADLASAQAQTTTLQGKIASYHDVTATIAARQAAEAQLTTAMGDEVQYSQRLYDLSLAIPGSVWLNNLSFTSGGTATAPAPGAAAAVTMPGGVTPIGTFTVSGIGFSHDDVALWLEAIAGLSKTYANPYFSSSTEALIGARKTVNFTGTAVVLSTAESGRYNKPFGG